MEELIPGIDYLVREGACNEGWLSFPDTERTAHWRHSWIMKRRPRPVVPVFAGAPMPRQGEETSERNAMLIMTYFRPWVLSADMATEHVACARGLRAENESWSEALQHWFSSGLLTQESKRYVANFLNVTRARPPDDDDQSQNSEDLVEDEPIVLSTNDLRDVLTTRIGGGRGRQGEHDDETAAGHYENSKSAIEKIDQVWGAIPSTSYGERFVDASQIDR